MKVKKAKFDKLTHKVEETGNKGPSKTEPKHGKKNRIPYDATYRHKMFGWGPSNGNKAAR